MLALGEMLSNQQTEVGYESLPVQRRRLAADVTRNVVTEEVDLAMRFALIAPSPRNTQPWSFACPKSTVIELRRDRSRARPVCDPQNRELTISCGIALYYLRLALASLGVDAQVEVFPESDDPDLLATVESTAVFMKADEVAKQLVATACARRTNWGQFFDMPVPEHEAIHLIDSARQDIQVDQGHPQVETSVVGYQRVCIDEMIDVADAEQLANPRFVAELATWPVGRPGLLEAPESTADDITGYDDTSSASAGTLLVVSTPGDSEADWVAAGQGLARLLLAATGLGLSCTFLNQPVQVPTLRDQLGQLLHLEAVPQQLLQFGFAMAHAAHTPRREIEEVLVDR